MARTTPLFSNFLFTNLFSIKFLYFFIISSLFFLFYLVRVNIHTILCLTSNCMCRLYIDTNKGRSPFNGRLSNFSSFQISVHRKFKKIDQLIFIKKISTLLDNLNTIYSFNWRCIFFSKQFVQFQMTSFTTPNIEAPSFIDNVRQIRSSKVLKFPTLQREYEYHYQETVRMQKKDQVALFLFHINNL